MGALLLAAATGHATPIAARDGEVLARDGAVRFGLVGGFADAGPDLEADLRAQDLAFVVLAGDAVPRGRPAAYERLRARLGGLPAVPLPGDGERRGDPALLRFAAFWDGLGVRGLSHPVTWRAFDVAAEGHRWRVVVVDADREALGARWDDERFWLPKAVACDGCTDPVLILANRPLASAAERAPEGVDATAELHALVRRHADPSRLALVASGGSASPELLLPGGPWGEGWLAVGRPAGEPATLRRAALAPDFDRALAAWFHVPDEEAGPRWDADRHPVLGWWRIELRGERLVATLRMRAEDGWRDAFAVAWSRDEGWVAP